MLRPGQALISIKLDIRKIEALQLDISSHTVADCILRTSKLKLKQQVINFLIQFYRLGSFVEKILLWEHHFKLNTYFVLLKQHLRILDHSKLVVFPTEPDRKKLHFALFNLRNLLPKVIVKVCLFMIGFFLNDQLPY